MASFVTKTAMATLLVVGLTVVLGPLSGVSHAVVLLSEDWEAGTGGQLITAAPFNFEGYFGTNEANISSSPLHAGWSDKALDGSTALRDSGGGLVAQDVYHRKPVPTMTQAAQVGQFVVTARAWWDENTSTSSGIGFVSGSGSTVAAGGGFRNVFLTWISDGDIWTFAVAGAGGTNVDINSSLGTSMDVDVEVGLDYGTAEAWANVFAHGSLVPIHTFGPVSLNPAANFMGELTDLMLPQNTGAPFGYGVDLDDIVVSTESIIPEPSTVVILLSGLLGIVSCRKRR